MGAGTGRSSPPPLLRPTTKPAKPSPAAAGIHQGITAATYASPPKACPSTSPTSN